MINKIQKLQFELMKEASFNDFNGEKVVKDLEAHEDLWDGVVMDREGFVSKSDIPGNGPFSMGSSIDLIKLRDIGSECWNVDTVYILPSDHATEEDLEKLELLAKSWSADEVDWIEGKEAQHKLGCGGAGNPSKILRVWWD